MACSSTLKKSLEINFWWVFAHKTFYHNYGEKCFTPWKSQLFCNNLPSFFYELLKIFPFSKDIPSPIGHQIQISWVAGQVFAKKFGWATYLFFKKFHSDKYTNFRTYSLGCGPAYRIDRKSPECYSGADSPSLHCDTFGFRRFPLDIPAAPGRIDSCSVRVDWCSLRLESDLPRRFRQKHRFVPFSCSRPGWGLLRLKRNFCVQSALGFSTQFFETSIFVKFLFENVTIMFFLPYRNLCSFVFNDKIHAIFFFLSGSIGFFQMFCY